jgi:hypothetical protein
MVATFLLAVLAVALILGASNYKQGTQSRNSGIAAVAAERNSGTLQIWEATGGANPPATPETSISDDNTNYKLLATLTFGATAGGSPSSGTVTANAIGSDTNAAKSGTAEFFRERDDTGTPVVVGQGTAGESADTPDMTFDDKDIVAGGTVAISSLTWTLPVGGS